MAARMTTDPEPMSNASDDAVRAIAFYLPQFHTIPENDLWWGPGFTEWTNVTRARPSFVGHYQPHLPADMGFYDLRVADTRAKQAALAAAYGLHGFCYYYYWFAGKRLLETPVEAMLATGEPDFPYCLCWANENWTRRWDGADQEVLIAQNPSRADDERLIRDLLPHFRDPRYIRINGKPLFIVYRIGVLPNVAASAQLWRRIAQQEGIGELYLCAAKTYDTGDPTVYGFDAVVEFPPHGAAHRHDERATRPVRSRIPRHGRRLSAVRRRLRDDARPVVHAAPHGDARLGQHGTPHAPGAGVRACEPGGVRVVDARSRRTDAAASRRASG